MFTRNGKDRKVGVLRIVQTIGFTTKTWIFVKTLLNLDNRSLLKLRYTIQHKQTNV